MQIIKKEATVEIRLKSNGIYSRSIVISKDDFDEAIKFLKVELSKVEE